MGFLFLVLHPVRRLLLLLPLPSPPPVTHNLCSHTTCPHTTCSHTTCSHTTCPHTTSHHTTCHTTTCPHTTCLHTTCPHTTCHHATCLHTTCPHTTLSTQNLSSHHLSSDHFSSHHLSSHHLSSHNLSTHNLSSHNLSSDHFSSHHLLTHSLSSHHLSSDHFSSHHLSSHHLSSHNLSTHNLSSHNLSSDHFSSHHLLTHSLSSHNLSSLCVAGVARMALGMALVARSVPTCPGGRRSFLRGRCGTWRHSSSFHVAGVVLGDIHLRFTWQAWHLATWIITLRGRRGTYGTGLALVARLVSHGAVTPRPFVWQAWHFVTSAFTLCGRRGTSWHLPSFCVTHVALDDMDCYFAWQAWHLWHWVGSGGALGQPWRRDAAAFCVAGVALRDICLHFVWQAWHFVTSTVALCGRRDTWWHGLLLCVAGVTLMALGWLWWRTWSAMAPWRRGLLCGRRGTSWHLATWIVTLRGRRGTYGMDRDTLRGTWWHGLLLYVAGVALMALGWLWWRAWSAMAPWRRGLLCGRRGTSWHLPSLCVAGVALRDIYRRFVCQAWHWTTSIVTLRGRRGTYGTGLALVVRLVSQLRDIYRCFVWQAWHWTTSIVTLRGRRGTYGTGLALVARLVSHGAVTPRRFAWQAWHFVTSTFTLCGRRGTWRHRLLLCVAGVALAVTLRGRRGTLSLRCQVTTAGNDVPFWLVTRLVVASVPGDDKCCLYIRFHGWHFLSFASWRMADTFSLFLGSLCCTGLSRCVVCVPRGSLQRRCHCHMPLGCVSQKCNWRRLSGLCDRPRLSVGWMLLRKSWRCLRGLDVIGLVCSVLFV